MLRKTLTILAFFSLNLVFAQFASNQNASNFSKYATSSLNIQGFNSSKTSSLQSPYYAYQDSTTTKEKWYKTDTGTSLLVAGGLIATGTAMHFATDFKVGVRDEINRYLPDYHNSIDDYTQYLPYAAVFAFDAAGIRSKHSSMRKVSTIGTAIIINLVVVQGLKYGIAEPRPDGSSNNSFPSGHTATAFMGAHIFHKEFKHRSPFYSIAAYAVASFTGVFRQLNNRHWISDVFAGAGIGIGTTELAYFLNDGWWKERGINEIEETTHVINESKPSFIGVKVGYASLVEESDGQGLSSKDGFRVSAEGAYFLTKNFGIGGEIGFQSFPISIDSGLQQQFNILGYELLPEATGNQMYYGGVYYQVPFGKNSVGAKLLAGAISGPNTELHLQELNPVSEEDLAETILYAEFNPKTTFGYATGIYYKRLISKNLSVGLYVDYNIGDLEYSVIELDEILPSGEATYLAAVPLKVNYDSYAIGGSVNIMLW